MQEEPYAANISRSSQMRDSSTKRSEQPPISAEMFSEESQLNGMKIASNVLSKQPVKSVTRPPHSRTVRAPRCPEGPLSSHTGNLIPLGSSLYADQPAPRVDGTRKIIPNPIDSLTDAIDTPSVKRKSPDDTLPSSISDRASSPTPRRVWKIANQKVSVGSRGREISDLRDCLSEDIPIRAVLHGWDALGNERKLPPCWRIVRKLDRTLFHTFDSIPRLVLFRLIYLLLRFHSDPTPETAASLPSFYNSRSGPRTCVCKTMC